MTKLTVFQQWDVTACAVFREVNYWVIWFMTPQDFDQQQYFGTSGSQDKFPSETDAMAFVKKARPRWTLLSREDFITERRARIANNPPIITPEIHLVKTDYQRLDEVVCQITRQHPISVYYLYPHHVHADCIRQKKPWGSTKNFDTVEKAYSEAQAKLLYKGKPPTILTQADFDLEQEARIANDNEYQRQAREV